MLHYLRLLRIPNLLMIPFTMYLLRYGIVQPALEYVYSFQLSIGTMNLSFPDGLFLIVILINMLLGAAGYVINDYFDRKIDSINRPNKVIVGKKIPRRNAIILHFVLNGSAFLLAAYLSWQIRKPMILIVYVALSGIFWLYSTNYKKQFIIGNFVVSLLTTLVPLQVAYFDIIALNETYGQAMILQNQSFKALLYWILAFGGFAFLSNFVREIVKDMEDYEGDMNYHCKSFPIVLGINTTKIVVATIFLFIATMIGFLYINFLHDPLSKWYLLFTLILPLLLGIFLIIKAQKAKHYHQISIGLKIFMLLGVCYTLIARYVMVFNF